MNPTYENSIKFVKKYTKHPNNTMKTDVYKALNEYKFTSSDLSKNKIHCLDEFDIYSKEHHEIANKFASAFDNDECIYKMIETNINFKFDLAKHINAESCNKLSTYLFQLIREIKKENF